VSTVYSRPVERVLFDPVRDANPIFHHMEALWMLAGRDDATWLDQFVSDFSSRFAEEGGRMHGAYGKRWRDHFNLNLPVQSWQTPKRKGGFEYEPPRDQLNVVIDLLRKNPYDRQAVIGMWDPAADLGIPGLKDRPCNTQIYLRTDRRVRHQGHTGEHLIRNIDPATGMCRALDMTVCCRSNDAVYGAYGANAVHMSVLQEYLAARIGAEVGRYVQMSNNLHMYEWSLKQVDVDSARESAKSLYKDRYPGVRRLVDDPESFDEELGKFLANPSSPDSAYFNNTHFNQVALPMWLANHHRSERRWEEALAVAGEIAAPDWRRATTEWLERRQAGAVARETRE